MGYSIAMSEMSDQPPTLEELMEFPSRYTFRVLAASSPDLSAQLAAVASEVLGREMEGITERPSSGGRWVSVRLTATVQTADEIRAIYAAMGQRDDVRMVL